MESGADLGIKPASVLSVAKNDEFPAHVFQQSSMWGPTSAAMYGWDFEVILRKRNEIAAAFSEKSPTADGASWQSSAFYSARPRRFFAQSFLQAFCSENFLTDI